MATTLNAARILEFGARVLGVDHAGLSALALAARPGAGGVTLLPYLDGERTPTARTPAPPCTACPRPPPARTSHGPAWRACSAPSPTPWPPSTGHRHRRGADPPDRRRRAVRGRAPPRPGRARPSRGCARSRGVRGPRGRPAGRLGPLGRAGAPPPGRSPAPGRTRRSRLPRSWTPTAPCGTGPRTGPPPPPENAVSGETSPQDFGTLPDGRQVTAHTLRAPGGLTLRARPRRHRAGPARARRVGRHHERRPGPPGRRRLRRAPGGLPRGRGRPLRQPDLGARFRLDGELVQLAANEGGTTLHGGPDGFHRRTWQVVGAARTGWCWSWSARTGTRASPERWSSGPATASRTRPSSWTCRPAPTPPP